MPISATDISRLRRMVNEPTTTTYSDATLETYLSAWPLVDSNGFTSDNDNWTEAYDLHAAAADIWEEKAAAVQTKHDFSADGANYSSSQMYENAMKQARHHRAEQKAQVKRNIPIVTAPAYYPQYQNPIFDEDDNPDWQDSVI